VTLLRKALCLLMTLGVAGVSAASAQQIDVLPDRAMDAGSPVALRLTGLAPEGEVTVQAERVLTNVWERGTPTSLYRSEARFRADSQGVVDLNASPSLGGTYTGTDPSGLFWSMQPADAAPSGHAADEVKLTVSIGSRPVVRSSFRVRERPPGFLVQEVASLPGSYFAPHPGPGRRPTIIVIGGADTNSHSRDFLMPRLVAQGFSVLHFATYSLVYGGGSPAVDGLPTRYVDIPVDRLQAAHDWLVQQPSVNSEQIGLYGVSRNGAYALIAATRFPWVKAAAGIVPSDVVWEGWGDRVPLGSTSSYSWNGSPLPFVPYSESFLRESAKIARGQPFRLRTGMDEGRWVNPRRVPGARIPLETYQGALFLAGGELDDLWSSGQMVQNIAERRAEAGLDTTFHIFADAGHNLGGDGWTPTMLFESGASRALEARAQYRTWQSMVEFYRSSLGMDQRR
jgi:hypothetical protein